MRNTLCGQNVESFYFKCFSKWCAKKLLTTVG